MTSVRFRAPAELLDRFRAAYAGRGYSTESDALRVAVELFIAQQPPAATDG